MARIRLRPLEDRLDRAPGRIRRTEIAGGLAQGGRARRPALVGNLRAAGRVEEREALLQR